MPAPTFNTVIAGAGSGDLNIAITPDAANSLLLAAGSNFNTSSSAPSPWSHIGSYLAYAVSPGTSPVPLNIPAVNVAPGPAWSTIAVELPTVSTPALEQQATVNFGQWPQNVETHHFTGMNAGDCIVVQFAAHFTGIPIVGVTDTQGNSYTVFRTDQLFNGQYQVSYMAVAFGCAAGDCTVSMSFNTTQTSGQGFVLDIFTFSGVAVPPPPVPPLTPVVLNFLDPSGAPLAFGSVQLRLSQDASGQFAGGPQIAAGRMVTVPLDATGTGIANIRPTEGLLPSVVYQAQAFTAKGQPCWRGNLTIRQS